MLEIDYNLFPLSEKEQAQVETRAAQLSRRGKPPPLTPASFGRIVVVNPDDGFTLNHVPDDLRRPLRRAMLPVYEASKAISGSRLAADILEKSAEEIYGIVLELHSKFTEAVSFLRQIPAIQFNHPKCHLMLHGEIIRVHDLLGEVLSQPDSSCDFYFQHLESPITLNHVDQLANLMLELPRYPTLPKPFFSALGIVDMDEVETFEFKDLGRLYRTFGVGNIDELDISGKMRAKLVVLDIPLSSINFLRFSRSGGEVFHAVNLDGEIIPTSEFEARELIGREIPFHFVRSIIRKLPGKPEEEISMEKVRAMRVNCFDGHVSFLWKPTADYMPLYEVKGMRLHLGAENGAEAGTVNIDSAIITLRGQPKFGEVRGGIRHRYLEHIFRDQLARQVKLQHYASKLKIACLGPMAAQSLKLLKLHGFGQLVPQESLYYLCDTYDQIPVYFKSRERVQKLYEEVLGLIKEVFGTGKPGDSRPDLINHRLPLLQDWARGEAPPLEEVNAEHLDTIYKEMRVFLTFTESEFRRVGESEDGGEEFLARVEKCQQALLNARHLGNLVGGRYGQLPDRQSFPDFVFFGSDDEVLRNQREYYLPGLSFSGIFNNDKIRKMMQSQDFEFSVFLEEQNSLITYLMSQDFDRESDQQFYDKYFEDKLADAERELEEMQRAKEFPLDRGSEEFRSEVDRLSEMHQAELHAYRTDRDDEAYKLADQEARYFEALKEVNDYLEESGVNPEELLSGNNYVRALDQQLMRSYKKTMEQFRELVRKTLKSAGEFNSDKKNLLTAYLLAFSKMQKTLFQELQADYGSTLRARVSEERGNLLERMNTVSSAGDGELQALQDIIEKRQLLLREEFMQIEAQIDREILKNQNTMLSIREANRKLGAELSKPFTTNSGAPRKILDVTETRLKDGTERIMEVVEATESSFNTVQSLRSLYRGKGEKALELYFGQNELAMLKERKNRSRMQRLMARKPDAPLVPSPAPEDTGDPVALAEALETQIAAWRQAGQRLVDFGRRDDSVRKMREGVENYDTFQRIFRNFRGAVRNKTGSQQYLSGLTSRLGELAKESENITEVVESSIIPARATYAERIHIPNIKKKISYFRQAQAFLSELGALSFENMQRDFYDRAIFRRFYATQFRSGALFGMNTEMPIFAKLTNVTDGISNFHRVLRTNMVSNGYGANEITLTRLPAERLSAIMQFIEVQKKSDPVTRHHYLILPSTLTLSQALEVIQFKEELFSGLPQLLLIYVSKFDMGQIRDDEALRDRYFMAMKHNIIINIDDDRVIDNPKAISDYLLQQTLGCCHDIASVEAVTGAMADRSRDEEAFPGLAESRGV